MSRGRGHAIGISCVRRGPVSPGFVFESTSPHKHAVAATPEGLHDLAPRWRRASEGGGGIVGGATAASSTASRTETSTRCPARCGTSRRPARSGPSHPNHVRASRAASRSDLWAARRQRRGMRARAIVACSTMITKRSPLGPLAAHASSFLSEKPVLLDTVRARDVIAGAWSRPRDSPGAI